MFFIDPGDHYVNLFRGKNFLIKELTVNSKSSISLQKHHYRSEHWMVVKESQKSLLIEKNFLKKNLNQSLFLLEQFIGLKTFIENQ